MPAARVQLAQRIPGLLAGDAQAVGGAVQRVVVQQQDHAVAAELGVAFEHVVTVGRSAEAKCCEGILRRQLAGTPVGDPARVWPGLGV
jgi:hypothetical protein